MKRDVSGPKSHLGSHPLPKEREHRRMAGDTSGGGVEIGRESEILGANGNPHLTVLPCR